MHLEYDSLKRRELHKKSRKKKFTLEMSWEYAVYVS